MTTCRTSTRTSMWTKRKSRRWRNGEPRMRVLGIDCGTERTGYGVIDSDGRAHHMVAAGCIRSSAGDPLERRLLNIAGSLRTLIAEYRPDMAAVEEVFFAVNAKSALKLSHVRGVALLLIAEASIA